MEKFLAIRRVFLIISLQMKATKRGKSCLNVVAYVTLRTRTWSELQ